MYSIKKSFQNFDGNFIDVAHLSKSFETKLMAKDYILSVARNFFERSQDMGTDQDGKTAKLKAVVVVHEDGKTIDFQFDGVDRIDTRLTLNFNVVG